MTLKDVETENVAVGFWKSKWVELTWLTIRIGRVAILSTAIKFMAAMQLCLRDSELQFNIKPIQRG